MSTATLEPPVKTAAQAATELPDLTAAFNAELTKVKAAEEPAKAEAPKAEAAKEPVKETAKTEPAANIEPVKTEPGKKRSALDAALSDDAPVAEPVKDDVQKLLESTNPDWDAARATMKRQSEELKTFREKTPKASELPPETATELKTLREEAARLKRENDEYRDSVMAIDVRMDPGYQQKLRGRDTEVERVASEIRESTNEAQAQAFLDAMALPIAKRGKHLDSILESVESSRVRSRIEAKLGQIDILDEALETQVAQPHKSYDELVRQREATAQQQQRAAQEAITATFADVKSRLPKLSKFMRPSADDAEGAAEFNADLQRDIENAPKFLNAKSREEAAIYAYKVSRYDTVEKIATERFSRDAARIRELEDTVAKFEGAEPGFRGGGKVKATADWERPITDVFQEALRKPEI